MHVASKSKELNGRAIGLAGVAMHKRHGIRKGQWSVLNTFVFDRDWDLRVLRSSSWGDLRLPASKIFGYYEKPLPRKVVQVACRIL